MNIGVIVAGMYKSLVGELVFDKWLVNKDAATIEIETENFLGIVVDS